MRLSKSFLEEIRRLIGSARATVARGVDLVQVHTNFEIGRRIVEQEQQGKGRAEYGKEVIKALAERLTMEFGEGFSKRNLELMRRFFLLYANRRTPIAQSLTAQLPHPRKMQSPIAKLPTDEIGQIVAKPGDILKEPLVLEFLGLDEQKRYSESDLESAIISRVEHFLLEMGKGFLFEARQRRFTFDSEHYFVDLVFYNRLLRCYVLIDLKLGRLTHQDLGQMQMYVNYFDREVKTEGENSTVGIVLCRQKNKAMVKITLPRDANIHARQYQLYLPSKEELRRKLEEWSGEVEDE